MKRVLVLAYADKSHGFGHVMRCMVLAEQLKARGVAVYFATATDTPGFEWLRDKWPVVAVPEFVAPVGLGQFDALIIDLEQGPTVELLLAVRASFPKVINFGCIGFAPDVDPHVVDRLVDLQIYGVALFDPPRTAHELAGPRYLLIDPAFRKCKPDPDGPIVISLGGADPHNLTPIAIAGAAGNRELIARQVRVVVGPASAYVYEKPPEGVTIIRHPDSLVPILDGAAVCVTATGMTAYESLCAGVPVILTNWSPAHETTADQLERRKVGRNLGLYDELTPGLLRRALYPYLSGDGDWAQASYNARALVDGNGACRVTDRVCQLIAAP